jgi:archaetidylinositol phosphate synthase
VPEEADWSQGHHGIDPEAVPFVRGWLRVVDVACRPLVALRVPPDAVTAAGLLFSLAVPVLAAAGLLGWAVAAVLVSVLLDGLDGAVALRTDRVSSYGRALDSACDRVSELAWWVALVLGAGVPWWAAAVLAVLTLAPEGWRARTGRLGALTVWERPTRTILVVVGLAFAGLGLGLVTGLVGVVLAVVGAGQLVLAVRRHGS